MDKKTYSRLTWTETAVRGIRFGPDREEVARELLEHLDDKTDDLMRIFPDVGRPEATELALAQMGNPEEIGRELARIHKPWLGYLWRASQVLLAVAAVVLVVAMSGWVGKTESLPSPADLLLRMEENREVGQLARAVYGDGADVPEYFDGAERLARYPGEKTLDLGSGEVTVTDAALWEKDGGLTLCTRLTLRWDLPWEKNHMAMYHFQAEDSLGNHYGYELTIRDKGASLGGLPMWGEEEHWNGYTWHVRLENVPAEAEWVRFSYALRPEDTLTVNLGRR